MNGKDIVRRRPAETTSVAAAIAYLILYLLDRLDDPTLLVSLTVVIGFLPAAVTWLVGAVRK